ncbi:MAG: FAD:protein FMN transferase [Coriobacteriia bacterium]|nr:FAD:protein FMN transferase [Coriobacteriia bacterium]
MRELGSVTFRAFDTVCAVSADVDATALREVEALCARYELLLSRFNPDSRLFALNVAAGKWIDVGDELASVLHAALGYCERTGGLFDITMGSVCRLWDFKRGVVPDDAAIAGALAHVDWRNVQVEGTRARITDPQAAIDLGGMAKGYIADRVIDLLKRRGATSGVTNLGGNVACLGGKPDGSAWSVGLRAPVPSGGSLQAASFTSVSVRGKSVVTSGVYERAFVRNGRVLHHILDPRTGKPAETDVLSATVIAGKSLDADGYTTALIIMGADKALTFAEQTPDIEAILLTTNANLLKTTGITTKGTRLQVR